MDIDKRLDEFENYLNTSTNSSITTVRKYRNIVRLFLYDNLGAIERPNDELELDLNLINDWISTKNRTKSTAHYKFAIKHLLISQGRKDLAERLVPAKRLKRKKVFRFVNKETVQAIFDDMEPLFRRIAFIQYKTGARKGTVMTLRAENIDFHRSDKLIYITAGVNKTLSKGSKEITLRLSQRYAPLLKSWIKRPYGYIFLDPKCESMTERELITHIETLGKYYNTNLAMAGAIHGVDALSSHYLRHLYSDNFINAGGDPYYLQKALGHSRFETTERYISIKDKMVDRTIIEMEEF